MDNPYDDEKDLTDYRLTRKSAALLAALFAVILTLPPLIGLVTTPLAQSPFRPLWTPQGDGGQPEALEKRLKKIESNIDRLDYAQAIRSHTQQILTGWLGEGSVKVFPQGNSWLFYQPELAMLTGWGPLRRPPASVMKDPSGASLPLAKHWVLEFQRQLQERGVPLLLVPVPVKPMLYPEVLLPGAPKDQPLTHPDQAALYAELRAAGIDVLDLSADLIQLKRRFPLFLKQDTHWTPEAMQAAVRLTAAHIQKHYPEVARSAESSPMVDAAVLERESLGDLVELLDLAHPTALYQPEKVLLTQITGLASDPTAPVALLGDSFVNIYDDPTLGFGLPDTSDDNPSPPLRASFTQQLAVSLHQPLAHFARNGGGATQTRADFARLPDDQVRSKKLVIWVIACRDLILSPRAARDAGITWGPVTFNPKSSQPTTTAPRPDVEGSVVVEAVLTEKSPNQELGGTPYPDALHTAVYRVEKVVSGSFDPASEWVAIEWTFRGKKPLPPADFVVGQRYRLQLAPWDDHPELHGINLRNEVRSVDELFAERWLVEDATPLP
ncbi:MAG: hypothetical protein KDK99_17750 [Verrucomicrobiales bacterium]|nr:hypothetical protein [Verrucomicrobiales bacterium]